MKLHVLITTYNRAGMLKRLLDELIREAAGHQLSIDVFDDASAESLGFLEDRPAVRLFRQPRNGGVRGYWRLVNQAFRNQRGGDADFYFFLQDDMEIVPEFFERACELYRAIDDPQKIVLNLLLDQTRQGQPCWTRFQPRLRQFGDHSLWWSQWTDMCFLCERAFLEVLRYRIHPVPPSRWQSNRHLSTGVGEQISRRLVSAGKHLYQASESLVRHGNHESRLFPELRRRTPLLAVPRQPVIGGLTTIPSRSALLPRMLDSILPQLDQLHVYLNGFPAVPDCLNQPGITTYLDREHAGDLGDRGKFFTVDRQQGYYLALDDDIRYPADYVSVLTRKIEEYDRRCLIGVHGVRLKVPVHSYYRDRELNHFAADLEQDQPVHILGSGTLAFHTQSLRLSFNDFLQPDMADLWLAVQAQQQQVGLITVSRPAGWLQALPVADSIYSRCRNHDRRQTELVNSLPEWELWGASHRAPDHGRTHVCSGSNPQSARVPPGVIPPYGTHLPVLEFLLQTFAPRRILEFGLGNYSTPLFLASGTRLVSLETDRDWWNRSRTTQPQHTLILWPDEQVQRYLERNPEELFDLALVDGPIASRVPCAQALFGRCDLIVLHDSFTRCYGWSRLKAPDDYRRFDYRQLRPETSILAKNPATWPLLEQFCGP